MWHSTYNAMRTYSIITIVSRENMSRYLPAGRRYWYLDSHCVTAQRLLHRRRRSIQMITYLHFQLMTSSCRPASSVRPAARPSDITIRYNAEANSRISVFVYFQIVMGDFRLDWNFGHPHHLFRRKPATFWAHFLNPICYWMNVRVYNKIF